MRFHSSDIMQVKLSTLIGQLIKETMDERNLFSSPNEFLLSEFDCSLVHHISKEKLKSRIDTTFLL